MGSKNGWRFFGARIVGQHGIYRHATIELVAMLQTLIWLWPKVPAKRNWSIYILFCILLALSVCFLDKAPYDD